MTRRSRWIAAMYRGVCILLAALASACSPSGEATPALPPTQPSAPVNAGRLQMSGRVLDPNGPPVAGALVEVDYPAGGGPSNPPSLCPGFGFCWLATRTDNLGAYSVEFETRTWPPGRICGAAPSSCGSGHDDVAAVIRRSASSQSALAGSRWVECTHARQAGDRGTCRDGRRPGPGHFGLSARGGRDRLGRRRRQRCRGAAGAGSWHHDLRGRADDATNDDDPGGRGIPVCLAAARRVSAHVRVFRFREPPASSPCESTSRSWT